MKGKNPDALDNRLTEGQVLTILKSYLEKEGFIVETKVGNKHGPDIKARRGEEVWIIEANGKGSLPPMRNNYFLSVLGEILQRM